MNPEPSPRRPLVSAVRHALLNPYVHLLLAVYVLAALARGWAGGPPLSEALAGLTLFALFGLFAVLITRRTPLPEIRLSNPRREAVQWVGYFALWLALNLALWKPFFNQSGWLSNGLSFWGLLVLAPALLLMRRGSSLADLGLSTKNLRANLVITALSAVALGSVLLFLTPGGRFLLNSDLSAWTLLQGAAVSFFFAFLFAGFHEEFFFRAILQTRLSAALGSRLSGIAVATLLFGIYHLPFRLNKGATEGDLVQSLAICFTETILAAFVVSALWARTRNLLAPVVLHSLIDAISGSEMIMRAVGLIP